MIGKTENNNVPNSLPSINLKKCCEITETQMFPIPNEKFLHIEIMQILWCLAHSRNKIPIFNFIFTMSMGNEKQIPFLYLFKQKPNGI